jgi:cation diffusion facilitator family transporter
MMAAAPPKFPVVLSIGAAVLTFALKIVAYQLTDSVSLLSDALESLVNLAAAIIALASLYYAAMPVDDSHTYGHEKIEYFSCGIEGILILVAAGAITWYAIDRLITPRPLADLGTGALVAGVSTLVNLAAAWVLLRAAKASESIVLEADGKHLLADVWTSAAVILGLCLVWLTGFPIFDPLLALLVAANIAWTAFDLVRRSFNGLMDHALPPDELATVRAAITAHLEPGTTFHALRTRQAGAHRFADFHLLVPGKLSVQRAHDLTGKVEEAIRAALPGIEVTVHIEPIEEPAAWEDSALLPIEQAREGGVRNHQ